MMRESLVRVRATVVALSLVLLLAGCSPQDGRQPPAREPGSQQQTQAPSSPSTGTDAAGQALVSAKCQRCHTLARVEQADKTEAEWLQTIDRMKGHGLQITDSEQQTAARYLAGRE